MRVIHRCFQIVPSTSHLTMRATTSPGVEKKNGGSTSTPMIGTVVSTCHSAIATNATSPWNSRRFERDTASPSSGQVVTLHDLFLEHVPDLSVQGMESRIELDLGDIARPRQRHLPLADDLRGRARRHEHDAVAARN